MSALNEIDYISEATHIMYVAMHSVIFTSTAVAHLCMSTSVVVVLLYIVILCVSAHVCVCVCACVRACVCG